MKAGWCFDAVLPSSSTPTSPASKKSSNDGKGPKSEEKGTVEEEMEGANGLSRPSLSRFSAGRRGAEGGEGGERRTRLEGDHTVDDRCSSLSSSSASHRSEGRVEVEEGGGGGAITLGADALMEEMREGWWGGCSADGR